ncbi:hypothetical protein Tco_0998331 [Tanacetum coccineum]
MRQRRWIELFSDYNYENHYHPGKANEVADALSRKERIKPKRVRAMNMTIQLSIKDKILAAQNEASKAINAPAEMLQGLDDQIERRSDGALYYLDQIWVPLTDDVRTLIIDKAHKSKYSVHPGADKMYYDLRSCVMDFGGTWDIHLPLVEFSYNNRPETVQETIEKISQIKDRLKTARDRQKSYADKHRKPLEFSVGDHFLLKVSPWKCVLRFGKKGKLAPRFVRPYEITERISPVAYRLRLPHELEGIHDTFHVSNLKKCLVEPTVHVPLEEIQIDAKLNFMEDPVEILECEFKKLKRSRISIVNVRWNSKRGSEFT